MFERTAESLSERLLLQKANLGKYKSAVGATVQEETDVDEDSGNLQYVLEYADLIEANKKVVNRIKDAVYDGDPDDPVSDFPTFPAGAPPFDLKSGIKERFEKRNARWKTAAGYTPEIGIALGIIEASSGSPSPDTLQAASKLRDLGGYQYEADFKKQGMSAMLYQHRIKGTEKWANEKTALSSPVVINVDAPAVEGAAVQLEIRCRLLKGNTPVGEWSPIYTLTVNP